MNNQGNSISLDDSVNFDTDSIFNMYTLGQLDSKKTSACPSLDNSYVEPISTIWLNNDKKEDSLTLEENFNLIKEEREKKVKSTMSKVSKFIEVNEKEKEKLKLNINAMAYNFKFKPKPLENLMSSKASMSSASCEMDVEFDNSLSTKANSPSSDHEINFDENLLQSKKNLSNVFANMSNENNDYSYNKFSKYTTNCNTTYCSNPAAFDSLRIPTSKSERQLDDVQFRINLENVIFYFNFFRFLKEKIKEPLL